MAGDHKSMGNGDRDGAIALMILVDLVASTTGLPMKNPG
jgi:hypothetical protein